MIVKNGTPYQTLATMIAQSAYSGLARKGTGAASTPSPTRIALTIPN